MRTLSKKCSVNEYNGGWVMFVTPLGKIYLVSKSIPRTLTRNSSYAELTEVTEMTDLLVVF